MVVKKCVASVARKTRVKIPCAISFLFLPSSFISFRFCRWLTHKGSGEFKGCGYVQFYDSETTHAAAQLKREALVSHHEVERVHILREDGLVGVGRRVHAHEDGLDGGEEAHGPQKMDVDLLASWILSVRPPI